MEDLTEILAMYLCKRYSGYITKLGGFVCVFLTLTAILRDSHCVEMESTGNQSNDLHNLVFDRSHKKKIVLRWLYVRMANVPTSKVKLH